MRLSPMMKKNMIMKHISVLGIILAVCIAVEIYIHSRYQLLAVEVMLAASYVFILAVFQISFYKDRRRKEKEMEEAAQLTRQIEEKEKRFRNMLNSFNDVFWQYNLKTKELELTEKWTALTGYTNHCVGDLVDIMSEILHEDDIPLFETSYNNYRKELTPFFECSFRIKQANDLYKWYHIKGIKESEKLGRQEWEEESHSKHGSQSEIITGLISDVTVRKNIEEKITHMAYFDSLTELPNKMFIQSHLKESIEKAVKMEHRGSLVFIDIDDFKIVNTTFGHDYGDQLLKITSELLKITLGDDKMISRIGGDEFLLVLDEVKDKNDVEAICLSIISLFKYPFEIGDKSIYSSVSIGAVMFPDDGTEVNELFRNADAAMHKAKELNKNTYCFFDSSMTLEFERKTRIGNLLREAIEKNELYVVYQPQYSLAAGEIISMEALIRWNNNELGYIPPNEFIPIAESSGTINSIGRWVFQQVCRQASIWNSLGYQYETIAVNISAIQIQSESFVAMIKEAIKENGVEPSSIEIEITESTLMKNIAFHERKLHELKRMGVHIAIDDFGTGYSALNYLTYLPIDTLKIDKAFIDNITTIRNDRILASNIIKLSHDLNIKVVAEGVELAEQLEILKGINCDIIQGFYYSKPLPVNEMTEKLKSNNIGGEKNGNRRQ